MSELTEELPLDLNHQQLTKHGDKYLWKVRVEGTNDYMQWELNNDEHADKLRAALFAMFPDAQIKGVLNDEDS